MRVLVTGASGYIGRAVVRRLLACDLEVTVLAHRTQRAWPLCIRVRHGDVRDRAALARAVQGIDAVCHLAALTTVRDATPATVAAQRQVNSGGVRNLLNALVRERGRGNRPPVLVFVSSSAVYGASSGRPLRVDEHVSPRGAYGAAKLAAERAIGSAVSAGAIGAVTLRVFNAAGRTRCGATPNPATLIPQAVAAATRVSNELVINGDGTAMRDFVHVEDVADAVARALPAAIAGRHAIYNVGAVPASVLDVIRTVERVCRRRVPLAYQPASTVDTTYLVADTAALRADLSWCPRSSTLARMVAEQCRP